MKQTPVTSNRGFLLINLNSKNIMNDFTAEIMSEQYRSGHRRKANPNNPITRKRVELAKRLEHEAAQTGRNIADVSLDHVNQNTGDLQRYVVSKGEVPLENPVELSTQAFMLRQNEISNIAKTMSCSLSDAEMYLDESEAKAYELNSSDADNFLGAIFSAVGNVAHKGLEKLSDKRAAAGKKPGIIGFLSNLTAADGEAQSEAIDKAQGVGDTLKVFAQDVISKITAEKKKQEIMKMLPYIIGGVVVLILVVVLITKHASKK